MKQINFIFLALFSLSSPVAIAQTALKLKSQEALSTFLEKGAFVADLKEGFHFNDKAPNVVIADGKELKPTVFKARHLSFNLPAHSVQSEAALYVCDDAITFCETHHIPLKGGKNIVLFSKDSESATVSKDGFIQNDLKKALAQAKKKNQLVLMDFSARWCPGCIRYEKEIFKTSEFKKLTKNFIKLKVDVDQFKNFPLSEKYNILGIPTFIVINADQVEVDRLLDFQTLDRLKPYFESLNKNSTPLDQLITKASQDPQARGQIGQRLYAGGRFADSIPYLQSVTPPPPELLEAKIMALQEVYNKEEARSDKTPKDSAKKDAYVQELRQALQLENRSSRSLSWRAELLRLIDTKSSEAKFIFEDGLNLSEQLLKDSKALKIAVQTDAVGEFTDFEKMMIAQYKADLVDAAGLGEDATLKAWKEAAQIGAEYKISASRTGPSLRYLLFLAAAQMWPQAEEQAQQILKFDPSNSDVQRRQLKFLLMQKKYSQAEALAEKLIPTAEGRVQFWVAESLAKAYIGGAKKEAAKNLLTVYLARPEIQDEKMAGSKKSLEGLLKSVE